MAANKYLLAGLVVGLVVGLVAVGVTPLGAPGPAPEQSAATEFSAGRALLLLRGIAAEPRPIGSEAARRVRASLVERLRELHLSPRVQTAGVVSAEDGRVAGTVHNVIGRLPGRSSSRSVLLVAHYDSVPVAAGAADNGSGVATLLETARALAAGPRPNNDIVFLFSDGEERGLLGSRAFLRDEPQAYGVGVVLNFDSPGSSSPVLMYETSPGNGLLVRELLRSAPRPYASSLMYEVSRRLPVESDFRPFIQGGTPGMSFGALDGPAYDHTGYDSLENFRSASLQHEGDTALALARRFGDMGLWDLHRPDVVYFNIVDGVAVSYSQGWVLPLTGLAVGLFAAAVAVAGRRRLLTLRGVALSVPATAAVLAVTLLVVAAIWGMYRTAYEQRIWTETGVVISDLHRLGLVLITAAVTTAAYGWLLHRLRSWDLAVGALCWWVGAAVAVSLTVPGAAYLLTWPLVAAGLGLLAATFSGERTVSSLPGVLVVVAAAAPGVVMMSSATFLLLMSAGLKQVVTVVNVWLVAGLLVMPLAVAWRGFRSWLPVTLGALGLIALMVVGSAVAFDSEHPKFTSIYYRQDASGAATWQAIDRIDAWTRQFLPDVARRRYGAVYFPQMGVRSTVAAPAPEYRLRPPAMKLLSDVTVGDRRTVRLRLSSPRRAAVLSLLVSSVVGGLTARVDGRELQGRDTTILDATPVRWAFDYYAPPRRGIVVTLRFAAGPEVFLQAVDFSYGIPARYTGHYEERPVGMLPGRIGDGVLAERSLRLPAVTPPPRRSL